MRRGRYHPAPLWPLVIVVLVVVVGAFGLGYAWHKPRVAVAPVPHVKKVPIDHRETLAHALPGDHFTGVAAIYLHNKRVAVLTRGMADRKREIRNTANTMFEIDSVEKSLTAGLVMQAINRHELKMADKLARFYPAVPGAKQITVRELLDMTAGLSVQGAFNEPTYTGDAARVQALIKKLHYVPSLHGVGRYQPANYVLLVGILMQVTHQSYQTLVTNAYIKPLGLRHTRFAYAYDQSGEARGYGWGKHGLKDAPQINTPAKISHQELGTGQLFMSVDDLYALQSALVSGRLITPRMAVWLYAPGSETTYGGGLYATQQFRLSNGYGYGFQCFMRITEDGRNALVVMANCNTPQHYIEQASNRLAAVWLP